MVGSNADYGKEEYKYETKTALFVLNHLADRVFCIGLMPAHAGKIRVVATLTDLADFASAVGGIWSRFTAWPLASKIHMASDETKLCADNEPRGPDDTGRDGL